MNENNFCNKIYEKVLQVINMKSIYEFSMGWHAIQSPRGFAWVAISKYIFYTVL